MGSEVSLARRTSFKIGGSAKSFHEPESPEELSRVLIRLERLGDKPFILGGGANTLFPDGEFSRPVVSTANLRGLTVEGNVIRAECGVHLNRLIQAAIRSGLAGLEGFVGIPGTVGGAVMMNAGGGGWSLGEHVREVGLIPMSGGPAFRAKGSDIDWSYRNANLKDVVVAWVELELVPSRPAHLRSLAKQYMIRKARTQPLGHASAGCIFKNPVNSPDGGSAGEWIEKLGMKGLTRGGASVSECHANFIVNAAGRAQAADVLCLIEEVRARVKTAFGVRLETEIVMASENSSSDQLSLSSL
jgi:UDP-N-acetylmuramate dehydrogenase